MSRYQLIVAETFYSIQGEGQTMGIPSVFLRLAGCNLLCESAHWRCDTIEVWRKGKTFPFEEVLKPEWLKRIDDENAHLVITGGEPMAHQEAVVDYLRWLRKEKGITPIVEIETNGTIAPFEKFPLNWVHYWNVSPKLPNSGMPYERRVNEVALRAIAATNRAIFKFVISSEQDLISMDDEYGFLPNEQVMLMPAGDTIESLSKTRPMVVELCKKFGFRFSDRMHISIWDKKTGV
jgi:7-carboxy-7-deazaguanine synthase